MPNEYRTPARSKKGKAPAVDFDNALLRTELAKPRQEPSSELPLADWRRLETGRSPGQTSREGHTADVIESLLYIFGGLEFGRRSNTMIALDLKELKWRVINENDDANAPRARCYHASCKWGNTLFVQGGEGIETGEEKVERSGRFGSLLRSRSTLRDSGTDASAAKSSKHDGSSHHPHNHKSHGKQNQHDQELTEHPNRADRINTVQEDGRANAILLDDLHAYDTSTEKWTLVLSSLSPLPTKSHTMVAILATPPRRNDDEAGSQGHTAQTMPYLVCFGGTSQYSTTMTNQMCFCPIISALEGDAIWEISESGGEGPGGRSGHTMTVLSKYSFAIFGGVDSNNAFLNDIFIYNAREHVWSTIKEAIGDVPPPMSAHAAVAHQQTTASGHQISSRLLIYGGSCMVPDDSVTVEGDQVGGYRESVSHNAYILDVDDARWLKLTHGPIYPNPRRGHSMAILHGWRPNWFEPDNWGFKARYGILAPNMPKIAHIDDPDDDGHPPIFAVVYGGINSLYCNSDTWLLDMKPFVVARLEPVMPFPHESAPNPLDPANMTPMMKKRMLKSHSTTAISWANDILPSEGIDVGDGVGILSPQKILKERKESEHLIHTLRKETKDAQMQFRQELERRRGAEASRDIAISNEKATREELKQREVQLRETETRLIAEEALSSELRDLRDEALHMLQLIDQTRPLESLFRDSTSVNERESEVIGANYDGSRSSEKTSCDEGFKEPEETQCHHSNKIEETFGDGKTKSSEPRCTDELCEDMQATITSSAEVKELDLQQEINDGVPPMQPTTMELAGSATNEVTPEEFEDMARSLKGVWDNNSYIKMVRNATFQETFRRMDTAPTGSFNSDFIEEFKTKYVGVARDLLRWESNLFGPPKMREQNTTTTPRLLIANDRLDQRRMISELEDLFQGKRIGLNNVSIAIGSSKMNPDDFLKEYEIVHQQAEIVLRPERLMRAYEAAFERLRDPNISAKIFEKSGEQLTQGEFVERSEKLGISEAKTVFLGLCSLSSPIQQNSEQVLASYPDVGLPELTKFLNIVHPLDAALRAGKEARKAILDFAEEADRLERQRIEAITATAARENAKSDEEAAAAADEKSYDDDSEEEVEDEEENQSMHNPLDNDEKSGQEAGTTSTSAEENSIHSLDKVHGGEKTSPDEAELQKVDGSEGRDISGTCMERNAPSSRLASIYAAYYLRQHRKEEKIEPT